MVWGSAVSSSSGVPARQEFGAFWVLQMSSPAVLLCKTGFIYSLTVNQPINLANYCGGEKILSLPRFQHCGGKRPSCPRGSDAFAQVAFSSVGTKLFLANDVPSDHVISTTTISLACRSKTLCIPRPHLIPATLLCIFSNYVIPNPKRKVT